MMKDYLVTWELEIYAPTPEEAAREARRVQQDPESTATIFSVRDMDTGDVVELETI